MGQARRYKTPAVIGSARLDSAEESRERRLTKKGAQNAPHGKRQRFGKAMKVVSGFRQRL